MIEQGWVELKTMRVQGREFAVQVGKVTGEFRALVGEEYVHGQTLNELRKEAGEELARQGISLEYPFVIVGRTGTGRAAVIQCTAHGVHRARQGVVLARLENGRSFEIDRNRKVYLGAMSAPDAKELERIEQALDDAGTRLAAFDKKHGHTTMLWRYVQAEISELAARPEE